MEPTAAVPPPVPGPPPVGTVLRPVIFVVDATRPATDGGVAFRDRGRAAAADDDEPFDVRRTSSLAPAGSDDDDSEGREDPYESFLAALRGKPSSGGGGGGNATDDGEISLAASYASSLAPAFSPGGGGEPDGVRLDGDSPSPTKAPGRFASPFSRLRVGRWKASSRGTGPDDPGDGASAASSRHRALARDMEDDTDLDSATAATDATSQSDAVSGALSSYSRDNPPVHFVSRRARVVAVGRRHAFPPSKIPGGKMADVSSSSHHSNSSGGTTAMAGERDSGGNSWMSSYEIQNEGILPSGWLEKHARALPSALVVVTALKINDDEARRAGVRDAVRAVKDLRMTLAEKRNVPIHLVCLMREEDVGEGTKLRDLNAIRERICQDCYLPQSQVFLLKCPCDLEPDDFESKILKSPYLQREDAASATMAASDNGLVMNPALRRLDRSLRDTSALYYSRLAESQERKLLLWRNRYHNANASFEFNTLMAAMRCARYALKVGTLREFQMRTGGGGVVGCSGGGAGRWTDRGSSAMRGYEEAYRWATELHRRSVAWRAAQGGAPGFPGPPTPITPGGKLYSDLDGMASPRFSESPGGGIGVELSLPGPSSSGAPGPPPPPPGPHARRNTPASASTSSRKGRDADEDAAFFASLWEQARAVASVLNAKLLRSTAATGDPSSRGGGTEAEGQWRRHRVSFLAVPREAAGHVPGEDDDFFGPAWHRSAYVAEESLTYACVAEGRWRRALAGRAAAGDGATDAAPTPSFHGDGAPWKAYGGLSEALLGLRRAIARRRRSGGDGRGDDWPPGRSPSNAAGSGRKFVGSVVAGKDGGIGTMRWRFENEARRDHRAMALDYALQALDLLEENASLRNGGGGAPETSPSSCRLHYLAARLLMSLDDPAGAAVHLRIAAALTGAWPSLNLAVRRALFACEERSAARAARGGPSPPGARPPADDEGSRVRLLLSRGPCGLLSAGELAGAQAEAWRDGGAGASREVTWTHDDDNAASGDGPPFEFAASFPRSTHATSGDAVPACVSIRSRLGFRVRVESVRLLTTSGVFRVSDLERSVVDEALLRSLCRAGGDASSLAASECAKSNDRGVTFNPGELAFFMTEITLPSDLSDVALGGSSVDASKFIPKNGRLCNMGLSHAAGNICEARFGDGARRKISINGKPIALTDVPEPSSSFLGGIPLACHGVVLTLKRADGGGGADSPPLTLRIERPRLVSPLLRSGAQRLVMEECNYAAHAWARPTRHPWCLGPRVLRVLGPRPGMRVTNLTDAATDGRAVEGTVNRILLRLEAGGDEECHGVGVRLRCESSARSRSNGDGNDAAPEAARRGVEPHRTPVFVRRAVDPRVRIVTETGVALPPGWEPREDVGTDEFRDATSSAVCPHLGAGRSLLLPLDIFRPLDRPIASAEDDAGVCSTSYEVAIAYRQVRAGEEGGAPAESSGDRVTVRQGGSVDWIPPLVAEFSRRDGPRRPHPCGIEHASNMTTATRPLPLESSCVAADGARVPMRCSLEANALGSNVAASILRVSNEIERNEQQKELYSADSGPFTNQSKRGLKLSLSYCVSAERDVEGGGRDDTIPLGVVSVHWKPVGIPLDASASTETAAAADEFGSTHGPLALPDLPPAIFRGPRCRVLDAPFEARLVECPSTPRVGVPFRVSYRVTNRTAKSQSLVASLEDDEAAGKSNPPRLMGTGKSREEAQMAPFEGRTFAFKFVSVVAGRVLRPPLTVSSGRHQTWVIDETRTSSRYLFVMP